MAYCLRSFAETLEQVFNPEQHHQNWVLNPDKISQFESLFEKASFLHYFLDGASPQIQEKISSVENEIMAAAEEAEDVLESYITSQILSSFEGQRFTISPPDLGHVLEAFEVAAQELMRIVTQPDFSIMAGVEEDLNQSRDRRNRHRFGRIMYVELDQLRSRLTARKSEFDIIPIVGMGGMGKTTLARILYEEHDKYNGLGVFDCRAWVTVSQNYDVREILRTLVACLTGKPLNELHHQDINQLLLTLHKELLGRRYLIVLDDIWSFKAWDNVQRAFPRDKGSRIILTTRENTVASHVLFNSHQMHLLNEDDSWDLLCSYVFGDVHYPHELIRVGRWISKNCRGLPLALHVIGGFLLTSRISKEFWESVACNVSTILADYSDHFSGIFSRSFTHLPYHLKPCLLYMSTFPDDHDIGASKIIKLWVAEGFLKPIKHKSLEEAGQIYLKALVDSNLIFVLRRMTNGKPRSYGIHDLLRNLWLRKAQEKKFLCVKDAQTDIFQDDKLSIRLVSGHSPIDDPEGFITLKLASLAHSYLLIGNSKQYKLGDCVCFKSSLLRVLDVYQVKVNEFPEVFLQLVNLRYLAICTKPGEIPRSIYVLTNLQTLIVKYLMSSISLVLALPKLRHFELEDRIRTYESRHDTFIGPHESLQSLYNIPLEILAENLLGKLPKLRKLRIKCGYYMDNVDLNCFKELETLKCCNGFYLANGNFISNITFPSSLKKLTLYSCGVPESLLDAISMLPNLQVLKLDDCVFRWPDWEPVEGGFRQLQYLQISRVRNLKELLAESIHFPVLRHLVLRNCPYLREIPDSIGEIETLEMIEVDECKVSVFDSARRILEDQRSFDSDFLQLRLGNAIGKTE